MCYWWTFPPNTAKGKNKVLSFPIRCVGHISYILGDLHLESDGQMRPCWDFGICQHIKCLIVIDELIGGVQSLVWEGDDIS